MYVHSGLVWLALGTGSVHAQPTEPLMRGIEGGVLETPAVEEGIGIARYRAILFAAQSYPDSSGLATLQTPENDVRRLGEVLQDQYGFEVEIVVNPTRADIIDHLAVLRDAKPNEAFVVYYAGHGARDAEQDRTWWIPVDATSGSTANWVSNDDVAGPLRASAAGHVLLVSDSCFSGGLLRSAEERSANPQTAREAATLASRVSRWVVTSGGEEPVSDAGSAGMSVFAFHLHRSLRDARRPYVTVDGIFPDLRQSVIRDSEQMPESGAMGRGFHQGGQLVLWNRNADATAAAAPTAEAGAKACTLSDLLVAIEDAEIAYRAIHDVRGAKPAGGADPVLAPFTAARARVYEGLRCVDAPIEPSTAAAVHRLEVMEAVLTGNDERGVEGARAMFAADAGATWSVGPAPVEWAGWSERAKVDDSGPTKRLRPPLGGWVLIDGERLGAWERAVPLDRPYVFQFQRDSAEMGRSSYVEVGEPVPSYPKPGKAQFRTIGATLLLVGGTGALTSLPIPLGKLLGTTADTATIDKDDPIYSLWRRNRIGFIVGTAATGTGIGFMIASVGAR